MSNYSLIWTSYSVHMGVHDYCIAFTFYYTFLFIVAIFNDLHFQLIITLVQENYRKLVEVGYTAKKWGHILRFGYAKHIWCVLT